MRDIIPLYKGEIEPVNIPRTGAKKKIETRVNLSVYLCGKYFDEILVKIGDLRNKQELTFCFSNSKNFQKLLQTDVYTMLVRPGLGGFRDFI